MGSLHRDVGYVIFDDVFQLRDTEFDEWADSKITGLPEEYLILFQTVASGFSCISYKPHLDVTQFQVNKLQAFYSLHFILGYHMYLTERSLRTQDAPYKLMREKKYLDGIVRKTFDLSEESLERLQTTCVADEAIEFAKEYARDHVKFEMFAIRGHRLRRLMFRYLLHIALGMGYNFAHEVIFPQIPLTDDWPEKVLHASDILTSDS